MQYTYAVVEYLPWVAQLRLVISYTALDSDFGRCELNRTAVMTGTGSK